MHELNHILRNQSQGVVAADTPWRPTMPPTVMPADIFTINVISPNTGCIPDDTAKHIQFISSVFHISSVRGMCHAKHSLYTQRDIYNDSGFRNLLPSSVMMAGLFTTYVHITHDHEKQHGSSL